MNSSHELKEPIPVLVWGASSQAAVVTDIFEAGTDYVIHAYLDDTGRQHNDNTFCGKPVYRDKSIAKTLTESGITHAIIAMGDIEARIRLSKILKEMGFSFVNAIHPKAVVSGRALLGTGVVIKPGAVIDPMVNIGNHAYIGSGTTIGHDVVIGDYSNIVGGVNVAGYASIGYGTFIGTGASIKDHVAIGDRSVIGSGTVVTRDVPPRSLAKGVPAKFETLKKTTGNEKNRL